MIVIIVAIAIPKVRRRRGMRWLDGGAVAVVISIRLFVEIGFLREHSRA